MTFRSFLIVLLACLIGVAAYLYVYGSPFGPIGGEQQAREERPPTPVVLGKAETADIAITVEAVGDVVARESVTLSARVTARVTEIAFADGDRVSEGQVLVRLDPAEAQAGVDSAEAQAEQARQGLSRADQLAESGAGPQATADDREQQLEAAESQAESARERLGDFDIEAPFDGRLGLRNISVGALAQPGSEIVTIDTIDPIEVRFSVPERYLGQVKLDADVRARTPAYPDEDFTGVVTVIANRVDPALRNFVIEASLPNPDGRILPGMLMNVTLTLGQRDDAVVVPALAVKLQGATHYVFTVREGKAARVDVEVGQRDAQRIEVVNGLAAGDVIVVQGPQDLNSGQAVQEAEARPAAGGQTETEAPASAPEG